MLNYLWSGMILIGHLFCRFLRQNARTITTAALDSSKEAVTLCITMMGVMSFWTGLMGIAEKSGILKTATVRLSPLIHFLFPELPKDHPAEKPIAANIIANVLGLGWAATPAGLEAMEELQKLEEDRRLGKAAGPVRKRGVASNEMCTFLNRKYFFTAADPGVGDRLPEPVRKRESDSRCWTWDCGNGGQYRGGDFVLQDNGPEKLEFL